MAESLIEWAFVSRFTSEKAIKIHSVMHETNDKTQLWVCKMTFLLMYFVSKEVFFMLVEDALGEYL